MLTACVGAVSASVGAPLMRPAVIRNADAMILKVFMSLPLIERTGIPGATFQLVFIRNLREQRCRAMILQNRRTLSVNLFARSRYDARLERPQIFSRGGA